MQNNYNSNILELIDHMKLGGAQTLVRAFSDIYLTIAIGQGDDNQGKIKIWGFNKLNFLQPFLELLRFVGKNEIDIIHAHLFKSHIIAILTKAFSSRNLKVILHFHGGTKNWLINLFYKFVLLKMADKAVFISQYNYQEISGKTNLPISKSILLKNFISPRVINNEIRHSFTRDKVRIGFVGRLSKVKGWDLFLQLANDFIDEESVEFIVAGTGEDLAQVEKQVDSLSNTKLLGFVENMADLYQKLDVVVMPSRYEPMGLVQLESQANGVLVIASEVGGIKSTLKHNENAFVFKKDDYESLRQHLIYILRNRNKVDRIIKAGYQNTEKYKFESYMMQLDNLYKDLLGSEN